MAEINRIKSVASGRQVLVGVLLEGTEFHGDPLDELAGLATTAGSLVTGQLLQRRQSPDTSTYLGKGKVEELEAACRLDRCRRGHLRQRLIAGTDPQSGEGAGRQGARPHGVDSRHFCHARPDRMNLAWRWSWPNLQYSLPRLKQMWTHLSRIKMGVGMRGPGEKQLEVDRRLVEKRIRDLRSELKMIERERAPSRGRAATA